MKKVQLIARQNIIDPFAKRYHNDEGLHALDGIRFGTVKEIDDNIEPITVCHQLKQEFDYENPDWHADNYSVLLENGIEIECDNKL